MFSYVDKSIRAKLEADALLVTVDHDGTIVDSEDPSAHMSVLGPVPIPRMIAGQEVWLDWYPFVRRTELGEVQNAANDVTDAKSDAFRSLVQSSMSVNSVFAMPGFRDAEAPPVRVHSCCLTGDVFGSQRCDCGPQLEAALELMVEEGMGAVVYMSGHEGRGIGLWAKAVTYLLQDGGRDTYEANVALGLPEDSRDFSDAAVVLKYLLRGRGIRLLSNNPEKKRQLEANGQKVIETASVIAGRSEHNARYLDAKRAKGHRLPGDGK